MKKKILLIPVLLATFSLAACDNFINNLVSYVNESISLQVFVTGVSISESSLELSLNNEERLMAVVYPANASNKDVIWTSSNPSVVSVDTDGAICGLKEGTATITVETVDGGFKASCEVTVHDYSLQAIKLSRNTISMHPGDVSSFTLSFTPENASDKEVIWDTSNKDIVTVNNGDIKVSESAKNGDSATISVKSKNNPSIGDSCVINVIEEKNELTKTSLKWTYTDYVYNNLYTISATPSKGTAKLLVIPVWFSDSASKTGLDITTREQVKKDIKTTYFGTTLETGWQSVKTYYETESSIDGVPQLNLTGTVSDWYDCGQASSNFYSSSSTKTEELVKSAVNWYFSKNPTEKRTDYDSDKDGYLDGVMLIYAHPDCRTEKKESTRDNMWAYCYWLQEENNLSSPQPNAYFWASYDFIYGVKGKLGKYAGGDTNNCNYDSHTFIHEMGHMFGLNDYYDYSGQYQPAGSFSMQDYNVGGHDPYSVMALGWAKPYIPTTNCTLKITPFQENHDLILLTSQFNSYNSPFDEYILIEYFTPTGLNEFDCKYQYTSCPKGPSGSGLRIWHIDSRLVGCNDVGRDGYPVFSKNLLTSDITYSKYGVTEAFSNTYYVSEDDNSYNYISPLGKRYADYNILQLIRNSSTATYKENSTLAAKDLFKENDTFSIKEYSRQFINGSTGKMNNETTLGFSIEVKEMNNSYATIEIKVN